MSAKLLGEVWELDLPMNQAWVLMAMVDHADHEGKNIFPSLGLLAWKTGYCEQTVRRLIKKLREAKIVIEDKVRAGKTTIYRVDLTQAKRKQPLTSRSHPLHVENKGTIKATPYTQMSGVPLTPKESGEPSIEPKDIKDSGFANAKPPTATSKDVPEKQAYKPNASSVVKASSVQEKDNQPKLDWNDLIKAIGETFGAYHQHANHLANMLLGRSRTGEWKKCNLDPPATVEEVRRFKFWYARNYEGISMVKKPYKIQSCFTEMRVATKQQKAKANAQEPIPNFDQPPDITDWDEIKRLGEEHREKVFGQKVP